MFATRPPSRRSSQVAKTLAAVGLAVALVLGASWFPPVSVTQASVYAGSTFELQVAGVAGVPSNASAVTVNLTAVNPRGAGYLTAYPCGSAQPNASTLNFQPGVNIANNATIQVGTGGKICLYTSATTDLIADIGGWYPAGSTYTPLNPTRLLDTRSTGTASTGSTTQVQVAGVAGVPSNASAVTVNLTAVNPRGAGYLTAYPCGSAQPNASTLNFQPGVNIANNATIQVGTGGKICLYTSATTDLIADIGGWYPAGSTYTPLNPTRLLDTRSAPAGAGAFVEDFTGNTGFERFDHGMYHRDDFIVATTQWTGDHDLNCGTPDTQRVIHRSNPEESFYLCKDHLMTSVGDTSGYSIAWFSPKQTFQGGQITQVSWDVNVTDLGNRQWWEVSLVPVGEQFLSTKDFAATAAMIPTYGPNDIVVGKGPYGNDGNIYSGGVQRDPLGYSHVCDLDPEGCASKAIRRTFTITDNLNGTITFDYLGQRYTYPGKFPSQFRVYFKDHNYTPDKDGVPIGHTWHWDTIVIK